MDINSLNSYIDHLRVEKGAAANTIAAYKRDLLKYLNWNLNNPSGTIKEYALTISNLSPASLERNFSAIRSFHRFLKQEFNISDPTDELPETGKKLRLPKALSIEEVAKLIESAKDDSSWITLRDYLLLELLYSTGARVSEVIGINLNDVSESSVSGQNIWTLKLRGKGGKERIVPLGSFAKGALDDYLVRCRPSLMKKATENALLLNVRGSRLSRVSAWEIVKKAA